MKYILLAISSAALLTSCAGVHVKETYVATGAVHPGSIYVRPFQIASADFTGSHRGGFGERPIRRSLAPREFADALQEQLCKLAPAMVIEEDEVPKAGWIVEGEMDVIDAGSPSGRAIIGHLGIGRSRVQIHVRVIDAGAIGSRSVVGKNAGETGVGSTVSSDGVIYAFTVSGGSNLTGRTGSVYAPGLGYATPFDFRNAAERIMLALSTDPMRYGVRGSPSARY